MQSTRLRTILTGLLLLECLGLAGCAGPRANLWPFYFQETRISEQAPPGAITTTEVLYPLFALETGLSRHYHVLRPLYNYESNVREGWHRLQYLWPLGLQRGREGDIWMHRLWPLFLHLEKTQSGGAEKVVHGFLFPLVYWGYRPPEGRYFALLPLAGVTHGLLGDTFSFVAFPVYSYYRQGDYRRYNVLWPLFSVGGTPDGERRLLRAWPLYVHNWKADTYDHHYVLWPFVRWGTQQWGPEHDRLVRRYAAFHPFFASQTTRDASGKTVEYQRQVLLVTRKRDLREGKEQSGWSFLFSLIRWRSSPQKDELRIFPLYWRTTHYRAGGRESGRKWTRYRAPWPILWVDVDDEFDPGRNVRNIIVAPFYWDFTHSYTTGEHAGSTARSITLWPLATWRSERDGSVHFHILSHGWSDSSEGYKRNYRAFFDLFQYHSRPDGERETRLLWRLYHHRRGPAGRYLSVPLLATYDGIGDEGAEGEKSCSVLLGLIKYCWSEKGSRWRLLYVPVGR